jgi:hypothetical protein
MDHLYKKKLARFKCFETKLEKFYHLSINKLIVKQSDEGVGELEGRGEVSQYVSQQVRVPFVFNIGAMCARSAFSAVFQSD